MSRKPFSIRYPRCAALLLGLALAVAGVTLALLMQWGADRFGAKAVLVTWLAVCAVTGTAWAIWADFRDGRQ